MFCATGRTGKYFTSIVLNHGHKVVALVCDPNKIDMQNPDLKLIKGPIDNIEAIDELLIGVDFLISMLGEAKLQKSKNVNTEFAKN